MTIPGKADAACHRKKRCYDSDEDGTRYLSACCHYLKSRSAGKISPRTEADLTGVFRVLFSRSNKSVIADQLHADVPASFNKVFVFQAQEVFHAELANFGVATHIRQISKKGQQFKLHDHPGWICSWCPAAEFNLERQCLFHDLISNLHFSTVLALSGLINYCITFPEIRTLTD